MSGNPFGSGKRFGRGTPSVEREGLGVRHRHLSVQPIHTYVDGRPYELAGGRQRERAPVESRLPSTHSVVSGRPTSDEFLAKIKRELKIRFYARNTIKNYLSHLRSFLGWYGNEPHRIKREDVRDYLELLVDGGASSSHLGCCLSAIRTAFDKFCGRDITLGLATPRKPKRKPIILSMGEVSRILEAAPTLTMKLAIGIMYAAGLRNSEVCKLQVSDIDFERKTIVIRRAKGQSDRLVMLPNRLKKLLELRCVDQEGSSYLFPTLNGFKKGRVEAYSEQVTGKRVQQNNRYMSPRTLQRWVKLVVSLAGINKRVTPHSFRHAFATHLLENGTDIRFIQKLLGHQRLETTTIYTHVAQVKAKPVPSPLDLIGNEGGSQRGIEGGLGDESGKRYGDAGSLRSGGVERTDAIGKFKVHLKPMDRESAKVTVELLGNRSNSGAAKAVDLRKFLTGITVRVDDRNWVQMTLPEMGSWQSVLASLSISKQRRFNSPEFFEALRAEVARRFLETISGVG